MQTPDFRWLSFLQRRTDYVRKVASTARSPELAKEFEELIQVYERFLGESQVEQPPPRPKDAVSTGDAKSDLIHYLQAQAHHFHSAARSERNEKRTDDLKYLSGFFGAEAARFKNGTGL